ncbi:MAG: hypothetical protein Q7S95_00725 [bacterium]|nr:hypothetical protein [bacterium]
MSKKDFERICPLCDQPITEAEESAPLAPQFIKKDGKDAQVHSDCYFDELGEEVEQHPLGRHRAPHGAH